MVLDGNRRLPLQGVRILDLTVVWAGPHATQLLAEWGAEVIRVESTQVMQPNTRSRMAQVPREMPRIRKNWGVAYPDWDPGDRPWNRSAIFQSHARNKLSMTVDLRRDEGLDVFHRLLCISDVFIENNVPETIEKLHLTYDELIKVKPDLIMVRMPGYGLDGPYKNFRSFGTHLEATLGHTWIRGYPDVDPSSRDDVYLGDAAGGVSGALAVLLALRSRQRTGHGQLVEVAQGENFLPYLGDAIMDYTMNGRVHDTLGNRHRAYAPQGVYRCAGEDRWVTMTIASKESWRGLRRALGEPDWASAARFSTSLGRWRNQDELDRLIGEWTAVRSADEVMRMLQAECVPAGAVLDDRDLFADPHMADQGFFEELRHDDAGIHSYPGLMWTLKNTPNAIRTPPCKLGEHNQYVYNELMAFGEAEYQLLEQTGHIGTAYASHVP